MAAWCAVGIGSRSFYYVSFIQFYVGLSHKTFY